MRTFWISAVIATMVIGSAIGVSGQHDGLSSPTPSLEMHEIEGRHSATLLQDGSVLLVGGTGVRGAQPGAAEIYDPATRSFSAVGSLQYPRDFHTATRLADGPVVILGGTGGDRGAEKPIAAVEVYDPETRQFSVQGRLKRPRHDHSAVLLDDGRVLVVGGMDWSGERPGPVAAIEIYDPATQRSTRVGRLRQPRWDHDAFLLPDGRVLVIGMVLRGDPRWMDSRVLVEVFDPGSGESERLGRQGLDLMGRSGVRLADDRVLLVGGHRPGVLFDPTTERFEQTERAATSRSGESLTLLDDGRVLVLGGEELGPATIELYDPVTERFEVIGELHSARSGHEATVLMDGTVLLTGGYGYETPLRSAELFDPGPLDIVAHGPVPAAEASAPTPVPTPVLAPLGSVRGGGVIELPGSGFSLTLPEAWAVEVLEPDRDYRSAAAGDTWTALRAHAPDGIEACTVAVGVVSAGANDLELEVDTDETVAEAYWRGRSRLMVPLPRIEPLGYGFGGVTGGFERRAASDTGLSHDVLYGLTCLSAGEDMPDAAFRKFRLLPADASDASVGPDQAGRTAPASPGPLPALGATVAGGRIERTGSGFAVTLPRTWIVEVADPDRDVSMAEPGDAWEALRAHAPGRRRACSVYVGIVPLDAGPVGVSAAVDTDGAALVPYWSAEGRPTLVVPPVRFRQRSGSGSETVEGRSRLRADDAGLLHDVVYVIACSADGERDTRKITDSMELLAREP